MTGSGTKARRSRPIGIATTVLALRLLESTPGIGFREGTDVLGALLVTAALMLAVYTVVEIPIYGTASAHTLGFAALRPNFQRGFALARNAESGA